MSQKWHTIGTEGVRKRYFRRESKARIWLWQRLWVCVHRKNRALPSHGRGRAFKSPQLHHSYHRINNVQLFDPSSLTGAGRVFLFITKNRGLLWGMTWSDCLLLHIQILPS